MRKFVQVTHSAEKKIMGVSNGVAQLQLDMTTLNDSDNFLSVLFDSDVDKFMLLEKEEIDKKIDSFVQAYPLRGAKFTDLMVFTPYLLGIKYIVSSRFKSCLEDLQVAKSEYSLYPVELSNNHSSDYYLLFVPWISSTEILFSESAIFPRFEILDENKNYISINNYTEYDKLLDEDPFMEFDWLTLDEKFKNKDIIDLQVSSNIFFSERLFDEMMRRELTNLSSANHQIELKFK